MTKRVWARIAALLVVTILVAGCDKCGNRVKLNYPTLPTSCGANADPAK